MATEITYELLEFNMASDVSGKPILLNINLTFLLASFLKPNNQTKYVKNCIWFQKRVEHKEKNALDSNLK